VVKINVKDTAITIVKNVFNCPHCNEHEFDFTHLAGEEDVRFGPWACDNCNACYKGTIVDGVLGLEQSSPARLGQIVVLRRGNLVMFVKGFPGNTDEGNKYFYEQHVCVTNYLGDVLQIAELDNEGNGEVDPHGVFSYVSKFDCNINDYDDANECDARVAEQLQLLKQKLM